MRKFRLWTIGAILCGVQAFGATTADPLVLLKKADRARGAAVNGITWQAEVSSIEDGSSSSVTYIVKVRGNDALAEAIAPARSKGELILFNDRNLWYFKQGLRKPVAISPRQKLIGQASNGDIASTNYARDYEGHLVGEESVKGTRAWKLELKAKAKNVTYDRIRYWISKKDGVGIRAEFLTVGGQVFKNAEFEYRNVLASQGGTIPFISQMIITDASNPANQTTLHYVHPKEQNEPAGLFNVNNLIR